MRNRDIENNDSIEEMLTNLPNIDDHRSKEDVYQRLKYHEVQQDKSPWKKWKVLIPIASSMVTVMLIVIAILNMHPSSNDQSLDMALNESSSEETSRDHRADGNNKGQNNDQSASFSTEESKEVEKQDQASFHYQLAYEDEHSQAKPIYMATATTNGEYVIPITLLDFNETSTVNQYYHAYDRYIDEKRGLTIQQMDHLVFNVNVEAETATVSFTDDYKMEPTTSNVVIFRKMLNAIFMPYGIQQVILKGDHEMKDQVTDNGKLTLEAYDNTYFKQYQELSTFYLVPIYKSNVTNVERALKEMKYDEPLSSIQSTVPSDADIEIHESGQRINIEIQSKNLGHNQATLSMVEAILMTTGAFGYEQVVFDIGLEQIGKYDLTEPVEIPNRINPKLLQ
ncbi:hypothetical protein J416_05123 [Gracilibacillus halophilus YIM-C55.5]|uniref:Sigma-X negative effector n=1 Tax=Gracilibacillus halophilus YIM-C55.5 TaxID=1308866 RepID=N4WDN6_9BACI|nr:hypothetical protein [Gracilibacillus halophilus]ENH97369.1 hypothetical protein J416_05123 [Gracilibacillus halophilus YIM-C55.5]